MSVITIRLPEQLLQELDNNAHSSHMPRAEYIRRAIESMNHEIKKQRRDARLKRASLLVRKESMKINKEFSKIEYDPED